ncbi:MAG: hypothetical protein KF752_18695 [Pirellulaceae bacterium]|nr:hypothetical protein [Pirellulaceae bacterium]
MMVTMRHGFVKLLGICFFLSLSDGLTAQTLIRNASYSVAALQPAPVLRLVVQDEAELAGVVAGDAPQDGSPSDSTSKNAEIVANSSDSEAEKKPAQQSLAPLLSRQLSLQVQAPSTANQEIGTGLVPQPKQRRSTAIVLLPDGYARGMYGTQVYWRASNIQHFPLYFEDAMLERHGHSRCHHGSECRQSIVSGVKFFGTIPLLPYLHTLQPKHQCVYSLGHYRSGSAAPCLRDSLPYDRRAAIVESASAAAFFWAMPL